VLKQTRIDDAWMRQQQIKERFAAATPASVPSIDRVGHADHRAVSREMAAFR